MMYFMMHFCPLMSVEIQANSADPDEMQHYAAFHLGLHSLTSTHLGVSVYKGLSIWKPYLNVEKCKKSIHLNPED